MVQDHDPQYLHMFHPITPLSKNPSFTYAVCNLFYFFEINLFFIFLKHFNMIILKK